ncbi:sensor histidine kinase [Arcanobacterium buesumense]|uniref:Sensor histidine kinase n=1 Tax=Arcanobacterium buesumense TaxID=2722751 RepID=A0A6H2EMX8_9ACTO|nr:sensor histidine kinase [Arcanobacterium buesumense]QJC22430.1 sensor histidine kinase [Arcanobacterium buesumense]
MTSRREYAMGLFMALIWLAFLVFPLHFITIGPYSPTVRVIGYTLTAIFAILNSTTWFLAYNPQLKDHTLQLYAISFSILFAITITMLVLFSFAGFSFFPYLASLTGMLIPLVPGTIIIVLLGIVMEVAGWLLDTPSDAHALLVVSIGVFAMTAGSRFFDRASQEKQIAVAHEAISAERSRVARDVHDVVGHSLTIISLKSQLALRLLDSDPERARAELIEISDLTRAAITEVRATVSGLRMQLLSDELRNAIKVLEDAHIAVSVVGSVEDADPRFRFVFSWVVREAVTNILRHAHAKHVTCEISSTRMSIIDDGVGITQPAGNGLTGLRERIVEAGGRLDVLPADPGTRVTAVMDVRTKQ